MENKKKITLSRFIACLIILSLVVVGGLALRDAMINPTKRYAMAIEFLNKGEYKQAERAFLIVNEDGNAEQQLGAAYYLAQMYDKGAETFSANGPKAALFYEKAAKAGLVEAQYRLALMYDTGDKIPENRSKALVWMNEAAKQGMPQALYVLGVWIERGYVGDKIPMGKVVALYEAAAVQGHKQAMTSLVNIYGSGFGEFPHNIEKSVYWKNHLEELNTKK